MATISIKCGKTKLLEYNESTKPKNIENIPITFKIPEHPSYKIKLQNESKEQYGRCYTPLSFRAFDTFKGSNFPSWLTFTSYKIELPSKHHNEFVVAIHIENKAAAQIKNNKEDLLIYSHENNVDICSILPHLADLSIQLKCNVLTYDYSGFGCSGGSASIDNLKKDISLILDFANQDMNIPLNRIILYGQDIGAFPSLYISTQPIYKQIKGIIIISPILGKHAAELRNVMCPILMIHPRNDKVVLSSSLANFIKGMKNQVEWYPKAENIQEVFSKMRWKLFTKIKKFIEQIEKMDYAIRESIRTLSGLYSEVVYVEIKQQSELKIKEECYKLESLLNEKLDKSEMSSINGVVDLKERRKGREWSTGAVSDIQNQSHLLSQSNEDYSRKSINNCSIYRETYFTKDIFDSDEEDEIDSVIQAYY